MPASADPCRLWAWAAGCLVAAACALIVRFCSLWPCRIWLDVLLVGGHCRRGHGSIRPLLMCLLHGDP